MPGNPEFIPFNRELPKDSTSLQGQGEPKGKVKQKLDGAVGAVTEKIGQLKS